eukprot:gnl/TRDRNA2_/TRDRNA2_87085_c0_seq1.p1 gnl/TRDRNA2_/TRDRNA2_87085_c0~~gnl/TRDRNA2_/TRDRNA2_87085_c0_seq1.p1  ORF type:complete len:253 (-),score=36.74 gnl/TRDRNA2_/TRDRNA2_87085_c0_seq1:26-784(-)
MDGNEEPPRKVARTKMPSADQLAQAMMMLGTVNITVKIYSADGEKLVEIQKGSTSTISELKPACEAVGLSICSDSRKLKEFVKGGSSVQFNAVKEKYAAAHLMKFPLDVWDMTAANDQVLLVSDQVQPGDVVSFPEVQRGVFFVGPRLSSEDSRMPLLGRAYRKSVEYLRIPSALKDRVGSVPLEEFFQDALGAVYGMSSAGIKDFLATRPLTWHDFDDGVMGNPNSIPVIRYDQLLLEFHEARCYTRLVPL